ncbi:MAG: alpha/beta hydrolase [Lachnospiraceae bacterium]|nr:alpha/beta hydrolase [Lachnospiraceae bacterium]
MKIQLHPHYKAFESADMKRTQAMLRCYTKPEGLSIEERMIPGLDGDPDIEIRIFRPDHAPKGTPMIMDIHGGGFTSGDFDMDSNRITHLAMQVPAIVVALNYRLAPQHIFPAALNDCRAVWNWMYGHAEELGGDKDRMGLFGTSAGGNLCAALAFYVRDHGGPKISFNALNVPAIGVGPTLSAEQMRYDAPTLKGDHLSSAFVEYVGGFNGQIPSYYAVPNMAIDYSNLPPTAVVVAEYDPLRDEGLKYARNLMKDAIPVELYMMPRVGHGFDAIKDAPMTQWIWDGIVMSFQREFGMLEEIL